MVRSYLGQSPVIPDSCYVDVSAQILGQVELGEHSSVWMNAVLRGDVHFIRVGAHSNIQDCAVLHGMRYKHPVEVGDWVTIGHNATVHGCVIEDACLIGMGATILNNARVGEGSIIAAGAVVPESTVVPANTLWAGVPAKERRKLDANDRESILRYARNYVEYTATYLKERGELVTRTELQISPLRCAPVEMTKGRGVTYFGDAKGEWGYLPLPKTLGGEATVNNPSTLCHLDRSAAEWRDLQFLSGGLF